MSDLEEQDGRAAPEAQDGVGCDDGFERLWTPHRMAYIKGENRAEGAEPAGCPFCRIPGMPDDEGLVLRRGTHAYAVLNLYPYNPGHLLLCPYRHVAGYDELTAEETVEIAELTQQALRAIRTISGAHGFNVGMNLGTVAGAGIAAHLHQHVVPRWGGDTNFMPVVGHTKVLPQLLRQTAEAIRAAWPA
ncbi:MAG: HIT family protein [Sporichthyaceae bacterium]